jgi:hypothetical protein
MDVPVPDSVLSELRELRRELQGEPEGPEDWRSGLDDEARQRMLELVEATEEQLAAQEPGPPGASTQVRGFSEDTGGHQRVRAAHLGLVSVL